MKGLTIESKRVDVLAIIGAGHVLLAKTNSVLSCRHAIKLLEIRLRDALVIRDSVSLFLTLRSDYSSYKGVHSLAWGSKSRIPKQVGKV